MHEKGKGQWCLKEKFQHYFLFAHRNIFVKHGYVLWMPLGRDCSAVIRQSLGYLNPGIYRKPVVACCRSLDLFAYRYVLSA